MIVTTSTMPNHLLLRAFDTETAEDFLDALTPHRDTGDFLVRSEDEGWIYRGQGDAAWKLVPSAHRPHAFHKFDAFHVEPRTLTPTDLMKEEDRWVKEFAGRVADKGLAVPYDAPELRDLGSSVEDYDGTDFPLLRDRGLYALAQHYGVPTRLLDWSHNARVAAYFAAHGAARQPDPSKRFAVWALSRTFVDEQLLKCNPGAIVLTVPTVSNPNLHAQKGLFTLVRFLQPSSDLPPTLDDVIADFALGPNQVHSPKLIKVTAPHTIARQVMHYLHVEGWDTSSLHPGHASAAESLLERGLRATTAPQYGRRELPGTAD